MNNENELLETVEVEKELKFDLTQEDRTRLLADIVELKDQLVSTENEFSNLKKQFTNNITTIQTQLSDKISVAKQGFELRTVKCTLKKDFATATISYVYDGKEFERREMTPTERQKSMELSQPLFDMGEIQGDKPVVVDNILVGSFQEEGEKVPLHPEVGSIIKEETNRKSKKDLSTN